ncbi:MFS transporter [Solwaraspora sp. WMMD1047]|uniref:MFS transporter n=1 Tax=Solwaraspora sp. WMMD1047 TaxID=3016102 RepID=UPI002415A05C|nr:MFS transporter [Solwaraspora sp. WMMD1047]MDG4829179.1 MFS transporter [Solwaraspora sp. WMMD1047]
MNLEPYRHALALPGVRSLLIVSTLARIPLMAAGVTLTLYVVLVLGRGYAAAGLVGAALTVGTAIGAPLLGRLVDRRGLRPVLALTTAAEAVFWASAPALPYPMLVGAAFLGGLLALPVFSVVRQAIAALVPADRRRPAYALDSMAVELSFMVGPAVAVLLATTVSARGTMLAVGIGIVLAGCALFVVNPPVRAADEPADPPGRAVRRRDWLSGRLVGLLCVGAASTLVLGGTDVAVVAVLREADQVGWTGLVLTVWGAYSLTGGFAYGAASRPISPLLLAALLCLCTIPVGLGGGQWWLLALALLPAGLLCAPTLAATADAVSRLAPAGVRGEAMGLHGSAITIGMALGAPLAGAVIDATSPAWGFAATGLLGALVVLAVLPGELRRRRRGTTPADQGDPAAAGGQRSMSLATSSS